MSSTTAKVCFNYFCKEASDKWGRGWRRLTGEYAQLCDRCTSVYEEGKFCETFHLNAAGWRCCESCGKQIHCGCIVSFHMFVLLDAGGIQCLTCAKKSYILTPNPAWPPPSHFLPSVPERMKDLSLKTWNPIAGSGPVPWHHPPSLSSSSHIQSNVQLGRSFEINVSGGTNMFPVCDRLSAASPQINQEYSYEKFVNGKLRPGPSQTFWSESTGPNMKEQPYPPVNDVKPVFPKMDLSSTLNTTMASSSKIQADDVQLTSFLLEDRAISTPMGKQLCNHTPMGSCCEPQVCNGQAQGDRNQLHVRNRPQITDAELRKISRQSNSFVIPLFEKMLSASDAGRIGRLILPKRCAEAFFPCISQAEGTPIKIQDMNGKEWVLQFRFWSNNHSRMYVLEGITPCIQSMQLKAGDVVTFSWLEPDGKLVIGGRKVSVIQSSDQVCPQYYIVVLCLYLKNGKSLERIALNLELINLALIAEKIVEDKPIIPSKRKNGSFRAKSKRRKIETLDLIELKLTWKEAQGLMRPPANIVPSVVVVEGCEFEEFEEAGPVIGRPTIPGGDLAGLKTQWVQCEDCFKWRKVPADAFLPSRWICADNVWDPDRSQCSSAEELTNELLEHMLSTTNKDSSGKDEITESGTNLPAAEQGLHALANVAINEETDCFPASSENTTKHPRHKPGCLCIVCLQPPSGKRSKHAQSCECIICGYLKRRCKTLMEKRERKQPEKEEAETSSENLLEKAPHNLDPSILNHCEMSKRGNFDEPNVGKCGSKQLEKEAEISIQNLFENDHNLDYPFPNHGEMGNGGNFDEPSVGKGQIDLNIQPDKEEELSPGMVSGGPMKCPLSGSNCRFILFQ
ncbi:B3 domain-containing transcription repressor VAL2 [Striga hermonthica]|uniref:B3 domain-containing transcription repressor VAL2 n=1 Tax=Striga hermonthica TaxID=68872 RepID=A0A9N7NQX9_STRHE|nr:B3 domain-containing transcription repressor VAL2 [Striga hermonthica]